MIFPKQTIIGKKIPKQRFYENSDISPSVKKKFVEQIDGIVFANKFSKETVNIPKTSEVEEIFVFDITLKDSKFINKIEDVLLIIDKSVPYPILYQFKFKGHITYKIAYKKRSLNDGNKSVVDVYLTKKVLTSELDSFNKEFDGIFNAINMQILYDKLIKLFLQHEGETVEEAVTKEKNHINTLNEIERLENLMYKEKQADRQYEIHNNLNKLKKTIKNTRK